MKAILVGGPADGKTVEMMGHFHEIRVRGKRRLTSHYYHWENLDGRWFGVHHRLYAGIFRRCRAHIKPK